MRVPFVRFQIIFTNDFFIFSKFFLEINKIYLKIFLDFVHIIINSFMKFMNLRMIRDRVHDIFDIDL